jgi:hypothetical protein
LDDLWETYDPNLLPRLSQLLWGVRNAIYENILIVEKVHSDVIFKLIDELERMQFETGTINQMQNLKHGEWNSDDADDFDDEKKYRRPYEGTPSVENVRKVLTERVDLKLQFNEEIIKLADSLRLRIQGQE